MESPGIQARLPLKAAVFHVLLALFEGERHGYALVREIEERSGGRLRLQPGNLYRTLKGMLDDGLVEESARRPAPERDDERRRYYRITRLGRAVAAAEAERLAELVDVARAHRLLDGRRGG